MRHFRTRSCRAVGLLLLTIATPLLLWPASLYARAGGGEGYHGGGGGGGGGGHGGGGGGGGSGWILYLLFELFIHHPLIGLTLIVIAAILYFVYGRDAGTAGPAPGPAIPGVPRDTGQPLQRLLQHDPNFNDQAFYQRVNVAFRKIQTAWCSQNLAGVRPFISDGVHERFTLQFAEQKAEGYRDQMDNIEVYGISFVELRSDGLYDELSVRIDASAGDYHVSLSDGRPIAGTRAPERFVEVWSFLRHRGAVTQVGKAGLIEGNCPNCGAAVELNQSANCTHCKALLRSGQYDWVLSEITQEVEWHGTRHGDLPGVAQMTQRDPDFNAVELEDRASVMFWRKATADRVGKIDPLRKAASEAFCQAYAPMLRPGPDGRRQFYIDCAVGSVALLGVTGDAQGDRAVVEVRWSGKRVMGAPNQRPRVLEESHLAYSLFVLWRAPGSKTDMGKGISSAHCPTCGAPESSSASNACEYCNAVLNDGQHGWVLIDIADRNDSRGAQILQTLVTPMA